MNNILKTFILYINKRKWVKKSVFDVRIFKSNFIFKKIFLKQFLKIILLSTIF